MIEQNIIPIPMEAQLSVRDYYIARAPVEPQPWFIPHMENPRPTPLWKSDDGKWTFLTRYAAEKECGDNFSDVNWEAAQIWDKEFAKQRLLQWPRAWADEMLKRRD